METVYFIIFCLVIGYVIFWSLRNDDLADYDDPQDGDKKFKPGKATGSKDSASKENRF